MADLEAAAWSEVAGNNIQPSPDGWPPNSSPNIVYTTDREMMGAIKRDWNRRNAVVTSGGSANAQTLTFSQNPTALVAGQRYGFVAGFANTGATTLAVGGLAAKPILANGNPLVGGELRVNLISEVIYDGANYQLIGGSGVASSTASLSVSPASGTANLFLNKSASGFDNGLYGRTNNANRWVIDLGDATTEGSNAGSNLYIGRFNDAGAYLDAPFQITRLTGAVAIKGSSTNDSAATSFVGEYISSVVLSPGTTLTNNTTQNIIGLSVSAGDWDVSGEVWFAVGTGGAVALLAGINTVSLTIPAAPAVGTSRNSLYLSFSASQLQVMPLAPTRISLAATTTVWLSVIASFPSGTTTAYGRLGARRIR